jgi:hypothetical protein
METCRGCGRQNVSRDDSPRYDVLDPDFDVDVAEPSEAGPYCAECFTGTTTGQAETTAPLE